MSSPVPSLPSGPGCVTPAVRGDSPSTVFAIRSGSSALPTTVSFPAGSTIDAARSLTTRREPSGATLATISSTLKYWLRKPMSPGITTTPGIGGTTKFCPCRVGTRSAKPVTLRLGIGRLDLQRVGHDGREVLEQWPLDGLDVERRCARRRRRRRWSGSTTGKSIRMSLPGDDRERGAEVEGLEVRLVEDDALLADLFSGERSGRDLRDQQLVDHGDRRSFGRAVAA